VTGKPIEQCRLIPGEQLEKNRKEIYWAFYNVKTVRDGKYETTLSYPYPAHALRIEADGYRPAISRLFKSDEGNQTYNFKLQPAKSTDGVLRDVNEKPLAGVDIYIALPGSQISLVDGRFKSWAFSIRSGTSGSFSLPPQLGDYMLIAASNNGFAKVSKAQFETNHEIKLLPWGRVEGRAMIGDKPVAGGNMWLNTNLDGRIGVGEAKPPLIYQADRQTADSAGRFIFEKVMPETVDISRLTLLHPRQRVDASVEVKVDSGQTVTVHLGGFGRPVVGKIVAPPELGKVDWIHLATTFRTKTPHPPFPENWLTISPEQKKQWLDQWKKTPQAKAYFEQEEKWSAPIRKYPISPNADGSFRVEDVEAGTYELELDLVKPGTGALDGNWTFLAQYQTTLTVPPIPTGRSDKSLDMGILTLKPITQK
jgi:hypothetical protein